MTRSSSPYLCPPFTPMAKVLRPAQEGSWQVSHFTLSEEEVRHAKLSAMFGGASSYYEYSRLEPGTYARLGDAASKTLWMSDTPMERLTNLELVRRANGRVFVAGLGLGMVALPILANPRVAELVFLEKQPEVIRMVEPQLRKHAGKVASRKLAVICEDARRYSPEDKWDVVYFDIWADISADNHPAMKELHRAWMRAINRANPEHWLSSWRKEDVYKLAAEERRIYA